MPATGEMISQREFARRDGCSERLVRNAIKSGSLPRFPGKLLPAILARTAWRAGNVAQAEGVAPAPEIASGSAPGPVSLTEARRRREITLARLRRHEFETKSESWLLASDAAVAWRQCCDLVRSILRQMPKQAAAVVARCTSMGEISAVLHRHVYAALTEASNRDAYRDTGPDDSGTSAPEIEPDLADDATRVAAETAKVIAIGRLHQLNLDIARGIVVHGPSLAQAIEQKLSPVRTRLLSFEAELPPRLFRKSRSRAEAILREAVEEAMAGLADEMPRVSAPRDASGPENAGETDR
jgi:hypothetical protein